MNKEICSKIKYLLTKGKTISEIAKILGFDERKTEILIKELVSKTPAFEMQGDLVVKKTFWETADEVFYIDNKSEHIKLLLYSDTHFCSEEDRVDIIKYLADKISQRGVCAAFHSGDFFDGPPNFTLRSRCLKSRTLNGQVEYGVENHVLPCTSYLVSGNHEDWWLTATGIDILKVLAERAKNIVYLGGTKANVQIGNLKINIAHAHKNEVYIRGSAAGYLKELSGKFKPDILQTGHFHVSGYEQIGSTHLFKTAALQDLTEYAYQNGGKGIKSVWWVDVYFDDNGNVRKIEKELETFTLKKVL